MVVVWSGSVLAVALVGGLARAQAPTDVQAYAVFGLAETTLSSRSNVQGDVGCLADVLELSQRTKVSGAAVAPTVRLRDGAKASGGYFCNTMEGSNGACMTMPGPFTIEPMTVTTPGNLDVSAPKGTKTTGPLAPGAYGKLTIGTKAQATLAGGSYTFSAIVVGRRAKLLCLAACDVLVQGNVRVREDSQLGAASGVPASGVTFQIASQGQKSALDTRKRVTIGGSIYAPSGDVRLGSQSKLTGGLVGNAVTLGPRVHVTGPGG